MDGRTKGRTDIQMTDKKVITEVQPGQSSGELKLLEREIKLTFIS